MFAFHEYGNGELTVEPTREGNPPHWNEFVRRVNRDDLCADHGRGAVYPNVDYADDVAAHRNAVNSPQFTITDKGRFSLGRRRPFYSNNERAERGGVPIVMQSVADPLRMMILRSAIDL